MQLPPDLAEGLDLGASVAIDGVCLTVVSINAANDSVEATFDVMGETLVRSTLANITPGRHVNVERSLRVGDEVGGHWVSGHVYGVAKITHIDTPPGNHAVSLAVPPEWTKYLLPKGFVALDGVSLTLVQVDRTSGIFTVWLIPETLRRTTFGFKQTGDSVNLEIDSHTQTIVDTLERLRT